MPPSSRRGLLSDARNNNNGASTSSSSSHRNRSSGGGGGGAASSSTSSATQQRKPSKRDHSSHGPADLPDYEAPAFPLDQGARLALTELASANRDSGRYARQLAASLKELNESVRDINDAYTERRTRLRSHQSRRRAGAGGQQQQQQQDEEEEDGAAAAQGENGGREKRGPERAEEKAVMILKAEVPQLSEQIEAAVREVIDMQVVLEDGQTALRDAARQAEAESAQIAQRQRERAAARQARLSQREAARAERARGGGGGGVDDEDDENDEDEDEEMQQQEDDITGPLLMLEEAKHRMASEYQAKSMYARYGTHNEYIAFKKLWHDALHGAENKPLPDASRWFSEDAAGGQGRRRKNAAEDDEEEQQQDDDDDDDLIIDQEHVSLACPLSMQIMREPFTSRKCRHTFDKSSIEQFLGRAAKQCPQTGCSEMLALADFYFDQIMLRRVKRAEAAANANDTMMMDDDDDDDESEARGGYDDEPTMTSVRMTQERPVKAERGAAAGRRRRRDEDDGDA